MDEETLPFTRYIAFNVRVRDAAGFPSEIL